MEKKEIVCLTIGDPHFKKDNPLQTEPMTDKILALAEKYRPDFIVDLGDTLDTHETIHVSPLERATNFLKKLSHISPLFVLIGNHDRPNNSNYLTSEHAFTALKDWKNTTVVDKVHTVDIKGLKFTFVPFVPPGKFNDALSTVENSDKVRCIFAHQEFKGAKMGAIKSEIGDEWGLDRPLVVSGHIHDYDKLQPNLIYTGTPIQHGFGDREDKTISLFRFPIDVLENDVKDVVKSYSEERLELNLPKKVLVHLTVNEVLNYIPPENTMLKVIIKGTSAELKSIMKLSQIKEMKDKGIKVVYKDLPSFAPERSPPRHDKIRETLTYTERLYQAVEDTPELNNILIELFGSLNVKKEVMEMKVNTTVKKIEEAPIIIQVKKMEETPIVIPAKKIALKLKISS